MWKITVDTNFSKLSQITERKCKENIRKFGKTQPRPTLANNPSTCLEVAKKGTRCPCRDCSRYLPHTSLMLYRLANFFGVCDVEG